MCDLLLDVIQPGDRRDRLKYVLQQIEAAKPEGMAVQSDSESEDEDEEKEEEFYTPGSEDLLIARRRIAEFSLKR